MLKRDDIYKRISLCSKLHEDYHDTLEEIMKRGVITDRLADMIIDNHPNSMGSTSYRNWFELQAHKRVIEILKDK